MMKRIEEKKEKNSKMKRNAEKGERNEKMNDEKN